MLRPPSMKAFFHRLLAGSSIVTAMVSIAGNTAAASVAPVVRRKDLRSIPIMVLSPGRIR